MYGHGVSEKVRFLGSQTDGPQMQMDPDIIEANWDMARFC